jgi:D-alanyl-D-alanine carboxypeptidase
MRGRVAVAVTAALSAVSLVVVPTAAQASNGKRQAFTPSVASKLAAAVAYAQSRYDIPGVAVTVDQPGVGTFSTLRGSRSLVPAKPVNEATHFRIGSVTKTFTATVVLQLVEEHRLRLDEDVDRWEPHLPYAEQITISDLLDMHSGIFDEGGPGSTLAKLSQQDPGRAWTPQQVVDFAIADGSSPPGTWLYSDTNYQLLALIAQRVTGRPIDELVTQRILRPLHLRHTSFPTTSRAMPQPAATPYQIVLPAGQVGVATTVNPSVLGGAGAMISTLPDMARWARALGSGELLSRSMQQTREQLLATNVEFPPLPGFGKTPSFAMGYGLGLAGIAGYFGHNGIVNGFTSDVFYDPSTHTTIAVLFNGEPFYVTGTGKSQQVEYLPIADALFTSLAEIVAGNA